MTIVKELFQNFNQLFSLYFVLPALVLLGVYLTYGLKFVQISKLKLSFSSLFKQDSSGEGNISRYQAIASVLASNLGTGNISGMAIALSTGGPGSLVWMWLMAFLGSAIQFANCVLGVKYRKKNSQGEYVGGPMYYLSEGLGWKKIAVFFSIMVIFAAFGAGNFVQVNSMILPLSSVGLSPAVSGVAMAFLIGIVVLGGAHRIVNVSSAVVPLMAALYLGGAIYILGVHADKILPAISLIFQSAFGMSSAVGGIAGYTVMKALTSGFNRAIFATDTGTGIVPILQSGAKTEHPVMDGIASLAAPFLVMVVCSATVLTLLVTGAWAQAGLESTNMVTFAFNSVFGEKVGTSLVVLALFLFGFTTTIAWASCMERAIGYLWGRRPIRFFQILYIALVPVGAILKVEFVWIFADIALATMLVLNILGVAGLSKEVVKDTKRFFAKPREVEAE